MQVGHTCCNIGFHLIFRSCRYSKCLVVGMNPYLVGSCKQVKQISGSEASSPSSQMSTPDSVQEKFTGNCLVSECTKEILVLKYEEVSDNIILHPQGLYMKKLFRVDQSFYEQARINKRIIEFPSDYEDTLKILLDSIALSFLTHFLPEFSADSLQRIAESSSLTLLGIYPGLESCFVHESILDQFKHSYLASPAFLDFWRKSFPGIENLKAVPIEAYETFKSPWAPNIEHEEFVEDNFDILVDLVSGDEEVAKLLNLLALFSPVRISLSKEEIFCLKQFQSKISIMIYNHLLNKEVFDNVAALESVSKLAKVVENMNRCGQIFQEGIIHHQEGDVLEDIEKMDIGALDVNF